MDKYLILKATKHNWSLMGPGSWVSSTWSVYSNGFYQIEVEFNPTIEKEALNDFASADRQTDLFKKEIQTIKGKMKPDARKELKKQLNRRPWRDPLIICHACDGEAWKLDQYDEDGNVINTSGILDYIYGQEVLEAIVKCLPQEEYYWNAYGYVSVKRMRSNLKYIEDENSHRGLTRLIVCGGKDFEDYSLLSEKLDDLLKQYEYVELVSGHAKGADTLTEIYANNNMIPIKVFPADWARYGRGAGPVRNREILTYAKEVHPVVAAFWNGKSRGTGNMLKQAKTAGVECHIYRYGDEHE